MSGDKRKDDNKMCKAKEYTEQLLNIYNNINTDFDHYSNELSQVDLYEQDILHIIESGGFSASEGYKLAKMICENRQKRRIIKNELEPLMQLKNNFIDNNMKALDNTHQNVARKDAILTQLTENKVYTPRVLESKDIKVVTNNANVKNKVMTYKRTNREIVKWMYIDDNVIYALFNNKLKGLVNKKDIVNFDETRKVINF